MPKGDIVLEPLSQMVIVIFYFRWMIMNGAPISCYVGIWSTVKGNLMSLWVVFLRERYINVLNEWILKALFVIPLKVFVLLSFCSCPVCQFPRWTDWWPLATGFILMQCMKLVSLFIGYKKGTGKLTSCSGSGSDDQLRWSLGRRKWSWQAWQLVPHSGRRWIHPWYDFSLV